VTVPEERKRESHLRRLDHILGNMHVRDPRPLDVARAPAEREIGVCRHFSLLFVGALRARGTPVRARVGFGSYLNPGRLEDHWVGEYWNASERRWILVDAQLDALQRKHMKVDFDPLDVPHDRFIIAHDAWTRCRSGALDPNQVGFSFVQMQGLWFVLGSLIRDTAALNGMELLPWDVWGGMSKPNATLTPDEIAFGDRLAKLTATPDEHAKELRALYESDQRLRPGPTVWNDRTQQNEPIDAAPAGVPIE
jgi:hypothetical protein